MSKIKIVFYLILVFIVYKGFVAIKNFEKAISIDSNYTLAQSNLSAIHEKFGKKDG